MRWIRSHLSFANVISVIALFVALGGASYAAVSLPANSVGPKQIKKRAVRSRHINKNAVSASKIQGDSISGAKVADGSLAGVDILDNSLTADDLADNSVGTGELADGSVGSSKVTDGSLGENDLQPGLLDVDPPTVTVRYELAAAALADGTSASYDVTCPAGQIAIGGGARGDATDSEYTVTSSSRPLRSGGAFPIDGQNFIGWRATVVNPTGATPGFPAAPPDGPINPEVWAICVSIP
jgi:hypothetical protein